MRTSAQAWFTVRESKAERRGSFSSQTRKADHSSPGASPVGQISFLQRTIGNRGVERLLRSELLQAKLKVNEPGDVYEREADRISDQVLAAPANVTGAAPRVQRVVGQPVDETAAAPASVERALGSASRPLEPTLRQEMEDRFGRDFSGVRVHLGPAAEQSARDVNARAYTLGDRVVFGAGEFNPATRAGRRLLAHELTHVVQQSSAAANVVRRSNGFDDDEITREWPRAGTVVEPSPAGSARGVAHRPGGSEHANVVSGEIDTGGGPKSGGSGGGTSGGGGGGAASKAEGKAEKFAGRSGTTTTTKSAAKTTEKAATKTVVKAEEAALKVETKLGTRVAKGAGRLLTSLLPGPEDAIMLMADFAGSYQEAWAIIEERNTRRGIAMGIAAGMMGLDWGWVQQNVWRRFATRDVATQVIAAVGKAERSYNDGLVRGHKYGAGHPQRMKNRILGEVFSMLAQKGYQTDEEGLFKIETVASVAALLMPLADDFLRQAAERKQAREQREESQRRKEAKEWGCVGFKC